MLLCSLGNEGLVVTEASLESVFCAAYVEVGRTQCLVKHYISRGQLVGILQLQVLEFSSPLSMLLLSVQLLWVLQMLVQRL